jgi:hypothetical protein
MAAHSPVPDSHPDDSLIGRRHVTGVVVYLLLSAAMAAPLAMAGTSPGARILLASGLLAGFLVVTRAIVRRIRGLDEFQQVVVWRALTMAGLITVWFELFTGMVFLAVRLFAPPGVGDTYLVIALGPPEFWLLAIVFIRLYERAYATPGTQATI